MECYGNELKYAEMRELGFDLDAYNEKLFAEIKAEEEQRKIKLEKEEQEKLERKAAKKGITVEELKALEEQKRIAKKVQRYQKELAELEERMAYLKKYIAENAQ